MLLAFTCTYDPAHTFLNVPTTKWSFVLYNTVVTAIKSMTDFWNKIIMFCIIILLNNCKGQIRLGWTHTRICKNIKIWFKSQNRILTNRQEGAPLHWSLVCTNNDSSLPPDRRDFWWQHSSVIGISHVNRTTIRSHSEQPQSHKIEIYGSSFAIINSEDLWYPACKHH